MEIGAISTLDVDWTHAQEKDNLSNLIKESLERKWVYKFPMPDWYKKAKSISNMAVLKNNVIWIKRNDKLLLYVNFEI
jgi:hypothetical protein